MISTHVNVSRAGVAALLLNLLAVPAFAQVSPVNMDVVIERNGSIYSCGPDTCAVPGPGAPLPIPFPEITMTMGDPLVQDGRLRGRVDISGDGMQAGSIKGVVSSNTQGNAWYQFGSFDALSESGMVGITGNPGFNNSRVVPGLRLVPSQTVVIVLTSRVHAEMSATTTQNDCPHDESCHSSGASARGSVFIASEQHGDGSPENETHAGTDWIRRSENSQLLDSYQLSIPFSEVFSIGWSFEFAAHASPQGSAAVDFSSTVGFTGIGFYAANGFNLTPYMEWSFADGLQIPAIQIASPVPEPETYAMLLAGLGMLGFAARRRKLMAAAIHLPIREAMPSPAPAAPATAA